MCEQNLIAIPPALFSHFLKLYLVSVVALLCLATLLGGGQWHILIGGAVLQPQRTEMGRRGRTELHLP